MSNQPPNPTHQNLPPLAERIRPSRLSDFIGQTHLIKERTLLQRAIETNQPFSMIFWGPPGCGKTTLAKLLAHEFDADFHEMSAVSSGVKAVREILASGKQLIHSNRRTILFIDEIHRFSKSQQDALLHGVEDGSVILIGATTENPSFEVISPLLSRCKVLRITAFQKSDLRKILERALTTDIILSQADIRIPVEVEALLLDTSGGDARKLLNTLELALSLHGQSEAPLVLSAEDVSEALQNRNVLYDKTGDYHYDTISAFIKSVRGSDPDAAMYWLAVMLEGGEKPEFIARRLTILAVEDVGNADPYALVLANAAMQSVHIVGPPESDLILGQVTAYLAGAPKSNAAYQAIKSAREYVQKNGAQNVPLHLRNAPTKMMKSQGYGKDYQYPHQFPGHFVEDDYFPESISERPLFYKPTQQGREKFLHDRLKAMWKDRY